MTPRLSGHFSIFGLAFFVLQSLLGKRRLEKFAILTLKPRSHVSGLILTPKRALGTFYYQYNFENTHFKSVER